MSAKPYALACDRNRDSILAQLQRLIPVNNSEAARLLEIGSGTGQHAVFLADKLREKKLIWQPSDIAENLDGIRLWQQDEPNPSCLPPLELDLAAAGWAPGHYDYVFSANTLHIVSWPLVENFIAGVSITLKPCGKCFIYGPFNYDGNYTSDSNRDFDQWLKQRDPLSGIRDFEAIAGLARQQAQALDIIHDIAMPANNRLLVFQKH